MPARPRPLTLRTGRRQTSSPTALPQRRGASRQLRERWTGEYNSRGFVTVAGRATSRTTHYNKRNKPRAHCGRGDQQADLQTKTQDSSDPTNPPGSRHANALSLPTDKPNEPAGEPPGRPLRLASTSEKEPQTAEGKSKVTLVPNLRWQVPRVQEHMARQRRSTTWSRSETQ